MAALCMHARGQLEEAVRGYDALLSLKPGHQAWYTRECCVYLWSNIRRPWREFSPDVELDPEFKVSGWPDGGGTLGVRRGKCGCGGDRALCFGRAHSELVIVCFQGVQLMPEKTLLESFCTNAQPPSSPSRAAVSLWRNRQALTRTPPTDPFSPTLTQEAWCKRHDPMTLRHYTRHRKPTGAQARVTLAEVRTAPPAKPSSSPEEKTDKTDPIKTAAANFAQPVVVESVLRAAAPIGPGIQLRCPGFLSNSRQHRMFGLASLELAQLVRRHWDSVKAGGTGAMVPDAGSSRSVVGKLPAGGGGVGGHPVGYRDLFDVAVRWRQLSEPNDPVWWIDRLTSGAFREGFGLQTPMVNGQLKVRFICWHHFNSACMFRSIWFRARVSLFFCFSSRVVRNVEM